MINDEIQEQNSGDNSTNVQAKNIIINNGITVTEARDIALDIYKSNFLKLSESAASIAIDRVNSFTDKFLKELFKENQGVISEFGGPSLQIALLSAQKECAKSGDEVLEDTLCNILIERAKESARSLKQITFDEAISVVPKLTGKHLDILTFNLLVNEGHYYIKSEGRLQLYLSDLIEFYVEIGILSPEITHIEYVGCCRSNAKNYGKPFPLNIVDVYPGMFTNGFDIKTYKKEVGNDDKFTRLLIKCPYHHENVQLNAHSIGDLHNLFKEGEYSKDEKLKIIGFIKKGVMDSKQLKAVFVQIDPNSEIIFKGTHSNIYTLELTPVGVAIALSNMQRKVGHQIPWPYRMREA